MLNKINIKLHQMLRKLLNEKSKDFSVRMDREIKEQNKNFKIKSKENIKLRNEDRVENLSRGKLLDTNVEQVIKEFEEIFDKIFENSIEKENIEFLNLIFNNNELKKITYDKKQNQNNNLTKKKEFLFFLSADFFNIPSKIFIDLKAEKVTILILIKQNINSDYFQQRLEDFKKELFSTLINHGIKELIVNLFDKKEIFYNNIFELFFNKKINLNV